MKRPRQRAKKSEARGQTANRASPAPQQEVDRICDLITQAAEIDLHSRPGPQLAALAQSIFGLESVGIFDADLEETYHAGEALANLDELVHSIFLFETKSDDPRTGLLKRVLCLGELPVGALVIRGEISGQIVSALAALAAATFDRYHALANESRTEAARRAEQLRTTVLDSLAHAYKTPLTAIRAAATGLAEMGNLAPVQAEMVALIDEQSEFLSQLTTRLLQTARLDAKDLHLRMEDIKVAAMLEETVAELRGRMEGLTVEIRVPDHQLRLRCDRSLVSSLMTEYLDNASKYAVNGSRVTVEAKLAGRRSAGPEVVFSVHSTGPAIPRKDQERIFDRYFRSSATREKTSGTGIGLAIAKQVARAHGGRVWVTSEADAGTTFFAAIPISSSQEREP